MRPRVNCFILADAAQDCGGKLYVMGGGWDLITVGALPGEIQAGALAMHVEVDWHDANQPIPLQIDLVDDDQNALLPEPINFDVTVGRPAHIKPGTSIKVPIALNIARILLTQTGGHVFILSCEGTELARASFTVALARQQ